MASPPGGVGKGPLDAAAQGFLHAVIGIRLLTGTIARHSPHIRCLLPRRQFDDWGHLEGDFQASTDLQQVGDEV